MRFAICNEIFRNWKIEEVFEYVGKLGYKGVELAPFTLADSVTDISATAREQLRSAALRYGVQLVGIHWVLVKPEGLYMNHPDATIRAKTSAYFRELVDFCADIGGRVMVVCSPQQRDNPPGGSPGAAWGWAAETLRPAAGQAAWRHVTILF